MTDEIVIPETTAPATSKCFVNEHCIWCGTCVAVAEKLFAMQWGHAEVILQPSTDEEKASFKVAQMSCPVWAIIEENSA